MRADLLQGIVRPTLLVDTVKVRRNIDRMTEKVATQQIETA